MKLQTASRIAVLAVLDLAARPGQPVPAPEIAARSGISPNHLAKVLRTLGRAGLVEAERGVGGGHRFVANPKRVTLFDVISLFEPVGPEPERSGEADDGPAGRALRSVLREIDEIAQATLRSITLATMLKLVADAQGRPLQRDAR